MLRSVVAARRGGPTPGKSVAAWRPGHDAGRARAPARYPDAMPGALIWLVVALGLAGAEALTGDMFLLMLGGGALAAAASSWLFDFPIWADGVVFLLVSVLLVVGVRPALRRRLQSSTPPETGIAALEGRNALVLDRVSAHAGQVKLDGEVWTARPLDAHQVYEPGDQVTVMHIDGATAVVWKNT